MLKRRMGGVEVLGVLSQEAECVKHENYKRLD